MIHGIYVSSYFTLKRRLPFYPSLNVLAKIIPINEYPFDILQQLKQVRYYTIRSYFQDMKKWLFHSAWTNDILKSRMLPDKIICERKLIPSAFDKTHRCLTPSCYVVAPKILLSTV